MRNFLRYATGIAILAGTAIAGCETDARELNTAISPYVGYCVAQGGTNAIVTDETGNQRDFCRIDGELIPSDEFYRQNNEKNQD